MKMKKIVATGSALALTAAVAVGGTLAWLQDDTGPVTNTFVWSADNNINLTLDETKVNPNGDPVKLVNGELQVVDKEDADRTTENTYTIVPGKEVLKDPTLHLDTETESYVYVTVNNQLGDNATIGWPENNQWMEIDTLDGVPVYAYDVNGDKQLTEADKVTNKANIPVFEDITFSSNLNATTGAELTNQTIVVNGYAVQATAGKTPLAAWDLTFGA